MPVSTPETCCPRCGAAFHCGAQQSRCDCFELRLSDGLRAELAQLFPGRCLCLDCLRALSRTPQDGAAS